MQRKKEIAERKRQLEKDSLARWQSAAGKPIIETTNLGLDKFLTPAFKVRVDNFRTREHIRDVKGLTQLTDFLRREEKIIGNSRDFEKFPPHEVARKAGQPVARLCELIEGRMPEGFGTGFMISSNILITNHHVFPNAESVKDCAANFYYEYDDRGLNNGIFFELSADKFFYSNKALDFALVYVAPRSTDGKVSLSSIGCIKLIETPGKIAEGKPVNIIQHPSGEYKQYAYKNNNLQRIIAPPGFLQYETDTLGGSSGSPLFNEHWELVGLHHCGIPEVKNNQIMSRNGVVWDGEDEDEIMWIANEGISISSIISTIKTISPPEGEEGKLIQSILGDTADPLLQEIYQEKTEPKQNTHTMEQIVFNFNGPATINIIKEKALADVPPVTSKASPGQSPDLNAAEKNIRFDEDYKNRKNKGYKSNFLEGFEISLPEVAADREEELYMYRKGSPVIPYYHYSLAFNAVRRMVMWTAVNIDYDKKNPKLTRKVLGTDTWRTDKRVPDYYQIQKKELYEPARNIDLGHIVRREDSAWGDDDLEIAYANADTFHYTNCTPQHEAFNRANPEGYSIHGIWGELEEHIKKELKVVDNKASVFAGPILYKKDPAEDFGSGEIQIPMKFWKVICVKSPEGELMSYGFILDQTDVIKDYGYDIRFERLPDFSKFKKYQAKIAAISKASGVVFPELIRQTDVLVMNFTEADNDGLLPYNGVEEIQVRKAAVA